MNELENSIDELNQPIGIEREVLFLCPVTLQGPKFRQLPSGCTPSGACGADGV
jgi:hypothetical protein